MKNSFRGLLKLKKATFTLLISLMLIMMLVCSLESSSAISDAFRGQIRITPEGTVEGTDKIIQNDDLYTLKEDLSGNTQAGMIFISIEKDNVTLDGKGHTIQGSGSGTAISAWGRKNLTIQNTRFVNFGTGIELRPTDFDSNIVAENNRILNNYFETSYWGISASTNNGFIEDNTIVSKNSYYGMLFDANKTYIANNKFTNGGLQIFALGTQNIFLNNKINDKPIVYISGQLNQVIEDAAQVILINCNNMVIRGIKEIGLRQPIALFGTTNSTITNCEPHLALTNSHSNLIINNKLSETGSSIDYFAAAIKLTESHNNTITSNTLQANNCEGISLIGSSHNHVFDNQIVSTGADKAAIKLENTNCEKNYIHKNNLTSQEHGIYLTRAAKNNYIFKNIIDQCKNGITISSNNNHLIGNNISSSTQYAVYLSHAEYNLFYYNNFISNAQPAYENHQMYWFGADNQTYYSEYNKWDNSKQGNYWSSYTGQDTNGDGIGETPYTVYENHTDNYPLTTPYDISKVSVEFEKWVPSSDDQPSQNEELQITILSPQNTAYNTSTLQLELTISQPTIWLGYSLDGKENVTITGNTNLDNLEPGTHNIIVYGNTTKGKTSTSQIVTFTVNSATSAEPEPFPTAPIVAVTTVAAAAAGVAIYFKKYKH